MKKSCRHAAPPPKLSESVHQRLNVYAMAASAAGVGLLALAQPAEAQVVYTPAHVILKPGSHYLLDLDNDGEPELQFVDTASRFIARLSVQAWGTGGSNNKVEIATGGRGGIFARALNRGAKIGGSQNFYGCGSGTCSGDSPQLAGANKAGDSGSWVNVQNRYLGIQFPINGETHYGWARISVQVKGIEVEALLTGYAYEATPDQPIIAGRVPGQTEGSAPDSHEAKPAPFARRDSRQKPTSLQLEPASLGILALGAQGLVLWRKEQVGLQELAEWRAAAVRGLPAT